MKLRTKLLLAQLPWVLAVAVVGIIAVLTTTRLSDQARFILMDNLRSVLSVERLKESLDRMDSAALLLMAGQPDKGMEQASAQVSRFEAELGVEERNTTESGELEATAALRSAWERFQVQFDQFQALRDPEQMKVGYFTRLNPLFLEVKEKAGTILAMNQDAMAPQSEQVQEHATRVSALMIASALAAFLIGLFVSTTLTGRLLRPLSVLTQAAHRVREGDLDARAIVAGGDEITLLAQEFNAMTERLSQYQKSSLGQLLQAQFASQAAIDSIPDPVIVFGAEGKVLNVNRASETLLSIRFEANSPDPLSRIEAPVRSVLERVRTHVLSGKGAFVPKGFEEAVRASSLEGDRYFLPRAEPVYAEHEGIIGTTVIMQDVTRLRRFDELKNDLVATVAHEFRTPLTSLRMAIHLCVEESAGPVTDQQEELLRAAREDCERLQTIVDDLLDLARIQSGRIEMHPERLDVDELVHTIVDAHLTAAGDREIALTLEVAPLMGEVMADPERIRIVFSNLLTNAIRHTSTGGRIQVRAYPQVQWARFEVSDTGEGIPCEYQRSIFDRFFRVPGKKKGGAGLGLSICQEIVHAHGGDLGLESEPGQGSTFWFTLPYTPSAAHTGKRK